MFDIFCVSESWLTDTYPSNKLQIPNYTSYRLDRVAEKVGGGLLMYTKKRSSPFCHIVDQLSVSDADVELIVLNYTEDKHRLMTIVHAYHPPSGSYAKCVDKITDVFQSELLEGRELWLIGDINIDLFKPDSAETKKYTTAMSDMNMVDKIYNITRPYTNATGGT